MSKRQPSPNRKSNPEGIQSTLTSSVIILSQPFLLWLSVMILCGTGVRYHGMFGWNYVISGIRSNLWIGVLSFKVFRGKRAVVNVGGELCGTEVGFLWDGGSEYVILRLNSVSAKRWVSKQRILNRWVLWTWWIVIPATSITDLNDKWCFLSMWFCWLSCDIQHMLTCANERTFVNVNLGKVCGLKITTCTQCHTRTDNCL